MSNFVNQKLLEALEICNSTVSIIDDEYNEYDLQKLEETLNYLNKNLNRIQQSHSLYIREKLSLEYCNTADIIFKTQSKICKKIMEITLKNKN